MAARQHRGMSTDGDISGAEIERLEHALVIAFPTWGALRERARLLNNLGNRQSELGQREAALASAEEALAIVWPFFLAFPPAFGRNTAIMLRNVLQRLQALGREPGEGLLERIAVFEAKMAG
jgi:hypothetical protein